jgi:hypothetical protein
MLISNYAPNPYGFGKNDIFVKMLFWIKQQAYYQVFYGIGTVYSRIAFFINTVQTNFSH